MANYAGRSGRPYEYVTIPPGSLPFTLPDECGAIYIVNIGVLGATLKNGESVIGVFPPGFLEGDFRSVEQLIATDAFAVLVSR